MADGCLTKNSGKRIGTTDQTNGVAPRLLAARQPVDIPECFGYATVCQIVITTSVAVFELGGVKNLLLIPCQKGGEV